MTRLLLGFLLFALAGCGGHVVLVAGDGGAGSSSSGSGENGSSSGSGGNNGSSSGGGGEPFPICPGSPPRAGWSCPTKDQGCIYVTQGGTCVSWKCNKSNQWESITPEGC
jgi:hypothetical protein